MKRILLLATLVVALGLPATASANEPAQWYEGDVPAAMEENEELLLSAAVGGYIDIRNEGLNWNFHCEVIGQIGAFHWLGTEGQYGCDTVSGLPCQNFHVEFNSNYTPLVTSMNENGTAEVDTEDSFIRLQFGGCPGYVKNPVTLQGAALHGTWENTLPYFGKIKLDPMWTGNGSEVSGELWVLGNEGSYQVEVGEGEFEEAFGRIPISIR